MEIPVVWGEIFLLVAFFVVWPWAMTVKCVRWWQHWAAVLDVVVLAWCRRAGADCANVAKPWVNRSSGIPAVLAACGAIWSAC